MDLFHIEAFHVIAKEKSFSRAAEILHLTQSSISSRILTLESQIKADLFIRNGRMITLTKYGEEFQSYAEQILHLVQEAQNKIERLKDIEGQRLSISTVGRIATHLLPKILNVIQSKVPFIDITIESVSSELMLEALVKGDIHLGLLNYPLQDNRFVVTPLIKDRLILAISRQHPLYDTYQQHGTFLLEWLEDTPILHYNNQSKIFLVFKDMLAKKMIHPKNFISINNTEAIKQMAIHNVGIAFLPRLSLLRELKDHLLTEIPILDHEQFAFETNIVYLQQKFINPSIPLFISEVQNYLNQHDIEEIVT